MKWLAYAILVVSLTCPAPASAQFYRYLDKQGQVRFTDDINQVPEDQRIQVRSYESSSSNAPEAASSEVSAENKTVALDAAENAVPETADAAPVEKEPVDAEKARLENLKKQIEAD